MPTINDKRWQDWCDKFLSTTKVPMTDDQAKMYMGIMLQDDVEFAKMMEVVSTKSFGIQVFDAHAARIGLVAGDKVRAFFAVGIARDPGTVVMYVHALRRFAQKKGIDKREEPLSMMDLHGHNDSPFAFGYLSGESLHALWDEQKLTKEDREAGFSGTDNYLDYVGAA